MALLLVVFLCINVIHSQNNIAKQFILSEAAEKAGAVCLDGSPANYYFVKGEESTKYVLFFQGGGWCFDETQCWSRRNASLGSTKTDPATKDFNKIAYLGNDSSTNPMFYNWSKVLFKYCDGMSFGGDLTKPIVNPQNTSQFMYYRGKRILDATFQNLLTNQDLNKATEVVLGGGSAGGLAVFIHTNYIANNFFNLSQTKLVSLPDVGFFIEYNGYQGKTQWAEKIKHCYAMQNVSSSIIDPVCFANNNLNESQCVFAQNIAGDNEIPTFILNSQYDSYQATKILGTGDTNATLLNEYGQNFSRILMDNFLAKNNANRSIYGAFIDGCYHHDAYKPIYWSGIHIDGYTQATAFMQFYEGVGKENNRVFWYQNVSFPCEACCPPNTTQASTMK
eukprot:537784_1